MDGGLLPRGEEAALIERVQAETRRAAWLSTLRHGMLTLGGWAVALGACGVAGFALHELHARPVMPPQMHVALVYPDRKLPPVLREDLTASKQAVVREKVLADYVRCREEYVWAAMRRCYDRVSSISAPAVRDAYQRLINDQQDPAAPRQYYGEGANAGTALIPGDVLIAQDPREKNAYVATYTIEETRAGRSPVRRSRVVRLVYDDGRKLIPYDKQKEFSPLGDMVTWYVNHPDQSVSQSAIQGGIAP